MKLIEKLTLDANGVAELLQVSKPKAYEIIRQLNGELMAMNKLTVRGRVSKRYLISRMEID